MLRQHIRMSRINRHRRGLLIGDNTNGIISIGFSLCHKGDKYQDHIAEELAMKRAFDWREKELSSAKYTENSGPYIPQSVKSDFYRFVARCRNYFKGCQFAPWILQFLESKYPHG